MSELINTSDNRTTIRWKLLTGASALALTVSSIAAAHAEDADRPAVWIDLGGQAERVGDSPQLFAPPFFANTPSADLAPMVKAQQPPPYSLGLDGRISFSPENSDWVLSAAVRYGKSSAKRHKHQQTPLPYLHQYFGTQVLNQPGFSQFGDGQTQFTESHLVIDFQAGKDVGLGLFGAHGSSVISAGVRFANFRANSNIILNARPLAEVGASHYAVLPHLYVSLPEPHYATFKFKNYDLFRHTYAASMQAQREARGVGPTVSWSASLPVAGNDKDMSLDVDWGLNAALLFGRQRTREHHKTSNHYYSRTGGPFYFGAIYQRSGSLYAPHTPAPQSRTRNVTIPNLGGSLGLSLKFPNAKISLGYRADVFFNAMDGGIDARKEQNRSFYGPYASISIGLGD
jgi:iron complex outermembrane receptor protein